MNYGSSVKVIGELVTFIAFRFFVNPSYTIPVQISRLRYLGFAFKTNNQNLFFQCNG